MADAYARINQVQAEFALYDELLNELAKRADGVPLGQQPVSSPARLAGVAPTEEGAPEQAAAPASKPRSPEYARILDRYIARLVSMKHIPDAWRYTAARLDRNPNDPGLYERLRRVPRAKPPGRRSGSDVQAGDGAIPRSESWSHKLARWYLRQKQTSASRRTDPRSHEKFSGTELESYFSAAVPHGRSSPRCICNSICTRISAFLTT